jgi:hypothetical protein
MSPLLRPSGLRLSWPVLLSVAVVAYVVESGLRGWDFTPDVLDVIVFGAFAAIIIARPLLDRALKEEDAEEEDPLG